MSTEEIEVIETLPEEEKVSLYRFAQQCVTSSKNDREKAIFLFNINSLYSFRFHGFLPIKTESSSRQFTPLSPVSRSVLVVSFGQSLHILETLGIG